MMSMAASPSAILVHEYVTGGGWPGGEPPSALGAEALALLRAVLTDFRAWGRYPVVATRDRRYGAADLPADEVVTMDAEAYPTALVALAQRCGAVLIIAPEEGGALERVSALVQGAGAALLGSLPHGIAVAADKWECSRRFAAAGLPAPRTVRVEPAAAAAAAGELGFPLVVKPVRGAGCAGVALVTGRAELEVALARGGLRAAEAVLLQRYAPGTAASVSLLVAGGRALPLSLNRQDVRPGIPFSYRGGAAGLRHERVEEAFALAQRAAALVPGLRGYVGVDLVLGPERCSLIEINARMTTSYVGLRRVVDIDLAAAVWRACRDGVLPAAVTTAGEATFAKEDWGVS
jgi:predicted ATP-grasp superfamily ATP-dependent carboligase